MPNAFVAHTLDALFCATDALLFGEMATGDSVAVGTVGLLPHAAIISENEMTAHTEKRSAGVRMTKPPWPASARDYQIGRIKNPSWAIQIPPSSTDVESRRAQCPNR
jgi:hypothetical protein